MHFNDVLAGAALTLVSIGIAFTVVHVAVWMLAIRDLDDDAQPAFTPWGYIGVGLAVSLLGFYLARGVSAGSWGAVEDVRGVVVVLGVASWGFGAAHDWATIHFGRSVRWSTPVLVSAVTGVVLGAAHPVLTG